MGPTLRRRVGLAVGAAGFAAGLWLGSGGGAGGLAPVAWHTAGVAFLMAAWWVTEALPLAATAMIPIVLFPAFDIVPMRDLGASYSHPLIMLFLGGFMMAMAIERWALHRRAALAVIARVGLSPRRVVLGFMASTALLSMFISNTATTLMMLPIALAVIGEAEREQGAAAAAPLASALLLGLAYAANIGGMGTPIGTPPNVVFLSVYHELFPQLPTISFLRWTMVGVPLVIILCAAVWWYLVRVVADLPAGGAGDSGAAAARIAEARAELGPMRPAERRAAAIFGLVALGWIFREPIPLGGALTIPGWADLSGLGDRVGDGTVAVFGALAMFLTPSGEDDGSPVLDWETARAIPWGLLLLFGGGIALAQGFKLSGLSEGLGGLLGGLAHFPTVALVLVIALSVTFLTEITSNTATTSILMPVLGATAAATGIDPLLLMLTATFSASCAFMLPVATAPNAIVYGSERVPVAEMIRAGVAINVAGAFVITALILLYANPVLG